MTWVFWMNAALSGFSRASPLPQKSRSVFALVFAFAFNTQVGFQAAVLLLLILGAPLNHAGRTQVLRSPLPTLGWAGIPAFPK